MRPRVSLIWAQLADRPIFNLWLEPLDIVWGMYAAEITSRVRMPGQRVETSFSR